MRRKYLLASVLVAAAATPVFAGYTATTSVDTVLTPEGSQPGPQVGDTFDTQTSGGFLTYTPDTPNDPQITGGDLPNYRYTLDGTVASVDTLTGMVDYTGTYRIFYDLNHNGLYDSGSDPSVSSGDFNITATFIPGTNNATLSGDLTQTAGPSNPAFADLSEGGNPVLYTGTYDGTEPGVLGTIVGTLRQNAVVVPEPASFSLLAIGAVSLMGRRRRRPA
jgi:hypothetical protein